MFINIVHIIGRLTKEPEIKITPSGYNVVNITVATNRRWKDAAGNKQEEASFHTVVAFGKLADTIYQYFHTGDEIYIQGRLKTSNWKDRDGKNHYRTDIVCEKIEFGQKSMANQAKQARGEAYQHPPVKDEFDRVLEEIELPTEEINIEDIPF
jgi:single-strand DNA-binding protein